VAGGLVFRKLIVVIDWSSDSGGKRTPSRYCA
jgi:hypothetical protein